MRGSRGSAALPRRVGCRDDALGVQGEIDRQIDRAVCEVGSCAAVTLRQAVFARMYRRAPSVDALILLSPSTSSKGTIAARYPAICPASIRCASPISISRINSRLRIPSRYRARIKPSRAAVICAPFVTARGRPKVPSRTYWEAVGRLATLVPSPSCPFALYPQQRIATAAVTAHVKYCPDVKATVVGGSCCTATNMLRLT